MTPNETILYIASKGYTISHLVCGMCVLKGRKIVVKQTPGATDEYADILKLFNDYLDGQNKTN